MSNRRNLEILSMFVLSLIDFVNLRKKHPTTVSQQCSGCGLGDLLRGRLTLGQLVACLGGGSKVRLLWVPWRSSRLLLHLQRYLLASNADYFQWSGNTLLLRIGVTPEASVSSRPFDWSPVGPETFCPLPHSPCEWPL